MLSDAQKGHFNILLIKDLSRLGRTMYHVGQLIESTFPSLNIRVISLNDNYDSANYHDDESIVLRTFLNEYYLKEFKKKIHQSIKYRSQNKIMKYVPKFGYNFDENHNVIIDEYSASIVKRIYEEYASGKLTQDIKNGLNNDNIPTKSKYCHILTNKIKYANVSDKWTSAMVWELLNDIEYTGTLVNLKRCKKFESVVKENTIPRIIDEDLFKKVKDLLESRKVIKDNKINLINNVN